MGFRYLNDYNRDAARPTMQDQAYQGHPQWDCLQPCSAVCWIARLQPLIVAVYVPFYDAEVDHHGSKQIDHGSVLNPQLLQSS